MTPAAGDLRHARTLWDYLRLGVPARPADCLLVFGGHDIGVARRAAELYASGLAPFIVVSGGSRAVPDGSEFPTEADAITDVLLRRDIPKDAIALERLASSTSENFWLSAELLRDLAMTPQAFLIVTKPYAERRTMATARRRNRPYRPRRTHPRRHPVSAETLSSEFPMASGDANPGPVR